MLNGPSDGRQYASLQLNGNNPVVSFFDIHDGDLKLIVCTNPTCAP
jgi:hypothetical protein